MSTWMDRRYTFSGTDAKCYAWFPQNNSDPASPAGGLLLESLQTISVSVREAKSQVRRLGQRSPAGLTRAIRTVAGSMIFAVIDRHPLENLFIANRELTKTYKYGWSMDMDAITQHEYYNVSNEVFHQPALVAGAMLPFNLLIRHVGEFPKITTKTVEDREELILHTMTEVLVGVEFIDEGKVLSVNDLYSEISFSFVALDYRPLAANQTDVARQVGVDFSPEDNGVVDAMVQNELLGIEDIANDLDDVEQIVTPTDIRSGPIEFTIDMSRRTRGN